jgi:tetratricopeptide (TPR) repeat protein
MPLASVLLSAALVAQAPPQTAPPPQEPTTPPAAVKAAEMQPTGAATGYIEAGLAAFKKRRFAAARAEFEKALAAEPESAAAAFYLGYTYYKLGEPSRRMNANKEKAKELFAKAFSLDPAFQPVWGRHK